MSAPVTLGYVTAAGQAITPRPGQAAFHAAVDTHECVCLLGGWGGGKSLAGRTEALKRAMLCPGATGLIVRRTERELLDSTWPECLDAWRPLVRAVEKENLTVALAAPEQALSVIKFRSARHEGREDPTKFGSVPFAWVWFEEGADLDFQTWGYLKGRMRQTSAAAPYTHGYKAWITTNPPETDHWIYREFIEAQHATHALVRASTYDNRDALPEGYIERLEREYDASWVRRYLLGDFGFLQTEHPVFREWREPRHVAAQPLRPIPGRPFVRGWDFGVAYAACVVGQVTPAGQLNVFLSVLGRNRGTRAFAEQIQTECAARGWDGPWQDFGDPSGWYRDTGSGRRIVDYLVDLGMVPKPGEQDPDVRLESVRWFLTQDRDGRPLLQVSPGEDTRPLRDGMAGGYHFRERPEGQLRRPVKNSYSHPQDALQYLCSRLAALERSRVRAQAREGSRPPRRVLVGVP